MPLMFITYGLQYLDKITLGYAAVVGLRTDAVRTHLAPE
jgi:ACS family allantoate permease-like MFS transporter